MIKNKELPWSYVGLESQPLSFLIWLVVHHIHPQPTDTLVPPIVSVDHSYTFSSSRPSIKLNKYIDTEYTSKFLHNYHHNFIQSLFRLYEYEIIRHSFKEVCKRITWFIRYDYYSSIG